MQDGAGLLGIPKTAELMADWEQFKTLLNRHTGLDLNAYKFDQTYRRIWSMVERAKCERFTDYFHKIKNDPNMVRDFTDKLAINVTELFRNPEQYELLAKKVLPDLLSRSSSLKIWSAGCSVGAEAHTISLLLNELAPDGRHSVLCTDIDESAMARARQGRFEENEMRRVPENHRRKYFKTVEENGKTYYEASAAIRAPLKFRKHNLLADAYETGFDLVVCRNVVIYFSDDAKDRIFRNFYRSLKPRGYYFVGNTERIFNYREIGFGNPEPFYYQKPETPLGGEGRNG